MVFQPFLNIALYFLNILVDGIDTVSISIPNQVYNAMDLLFGALGFLLPVKLLLPILIISGTLELARLIVAIVCRIKSFIPTMGD